MCSSDLDIVTVLYSSGAQERDRSLEGEVRKAFSKEKAVTVIDEVIREIMYIEKKKKKKRILSVTFSKNSKGIKIKEAFATLCIYVWYNFMLHILVHEVPSF